MMEESAEFGYWPDAAAKFSTKEVSIAPLPDVDESIASIVGSGRVENGWIYAPRQVRLRRQWRRREGGEWCYALMRRLRPYPERIFSMPKTHRITLTSSDGPDHITFHLWTLSFFVGLWLTETEAGYLDVTPIEPGKIHDFINPYYDGFEKPVVIAEEFWKKNKSEPKKAKLLRAIIYALFLAKNPRHLHFEKFTLCCQALDACFALAKLLFKPPKNLGHANRVQWMCDHFKMPTPEWAKKVMEARNTLIHEALCMHAPLGFGPEELTPEIRNLLQIAHLNLGNLICRFIVALIGGADCEYVRSSTDSRQRSSLTLP